MNSRLDEIQAAVLLVKLKYLDEVNTDRNRIANKYLQGIKNGKVKLPVVKKDRSHVWHIFAVKVTDRDKFVTYMKKKGIGTLVHYPIPIYSQKAYESANYPKGTYPIADEISNTEVSLPMYYGMTDVEVEFVIDAINQF